MNKDKWLTIVFTIGSCPSGVLRAIGFFILAPLLYNACEYLFNIGNTDGLKYVVYFADPYASWQKGVVKIQTSLLGRIAQSKPTSMFSQTKELQ